MIEPDKARQVAGSGEENGRADLSGLGIARKNGEMRARTSTCRKQTRPPVIPE